MVKKILIVLLSMCVAGSLWGQGVDNVTLVVSGDGPTKDAATTVALRSAIEQAFGVFVSANTTILNDELVKDEIATVSSGNVQSYEEISCVQSANGNIFITLKATVSVKNLVTYAQSKGSECEFAGALFGQKIKLIELNKKSAEKVLENMYVQLETLAPYLYDFELTISEPSIDYTGKWEVKLEVEMIPTENLSAFVNLIINTAEAIEVKGEMDPSTSRLYHYYYLTTSSNKSSLALPHYAKFDIYRLAKIHAKVFDTFEVTDNLGNRYFSKDEVSNYPFVPVFRKEGAPFAIYDNSRAVLVGSRGGGVTRCDMSDYRPLFYGDEKDCFIQDENRQMNILRKVYIYPTETLTKITKYSLNRIYE